MFYFATWLELKMKSSVFFSGSFSQAYRVTDYFHNARVRPVEMYNCILYVYRNKNTHGFVRL